MDIFDLYCGLLISVLALCVIIPVCKAISCACQESRKRREEREQAAAREEARRAEVARRLKAQAEADAEKARIAAEKKRKAQEKKAAAAEREAQRQQKQAAKLEAARQMAEYAAQTLQAEKELHAIRAANERKEAHAQEPPAVERPTDDPSPFAPVGNNAFAGHCVAFTGTLPGMTRAEAIQAVAANGGRAFEEMPACTTLLVVGDRPGTGELDRAEKWGVKKISPLDFSIMLEQPLTLELDQAASYIAGLLNDHNTCKEA
jgi:NAD-dependent DNA ligase